MDRRPIPHRALVPLVAAALVLTVSLAVVLGVARVLGSLGDATGQQVLDSIALGIGLLWLVDLVCLILAVAINALADGEPPKDGP